MPEPQPGEWPGFEVYHLSNSQREAMQNVLRSFEQVTIHLPYAGLNYLASPASDSAVSLERLGYAMDGGAYCGCKVAVIHDRAEGNGSVFGPSPMVRAFQQWGDRAAAGNFRLAVETNRFNPIGSGVDRIHPGD